MTLKHTIPATVSGEPIRGEGQAQAWRRDVASSAGFPALKARISVGAMNLPSSGDREFTIQVSNRVLKACYGVFPLLVVLSTTEEGGPSGTWSTSWSKGEVVSELAADQAWIVYTDVDGIAKLIVNASPLDVLYVKASVFYPAEAVTAAWDSAVAPAGEWLFDDAVNSGQVLTVGF